MKLYVFDACPFCTKVRALIGAKKIDCDIEFIPAGRVPDELSSYMDKLTVPILMIDVGGEQKVVKESEFILTLLDELADEPLLVKAEIDSEIQSITASYARDINMLTYPLMPQFSLPELEGKSALSYFIQSRSDYLGQPLAEAKGEADTHRVNVEKMFNQIATIYDSDEVISGSRKLTSDDLWLFAILRNLTMEPKLKWPESILRFKEFMTQLTQIKSFDLFRKNY